MIKMIVFLILTFLLVTINSAKLDSFGYKNDGNDLVTLVGYWLDQWRWSCHHGTTKRCYYPQSVINATTSLISHSHVREDGLF